MQERISAMMDDQASAQEIDALLQALAHDELLRDRWEAYQLTGDVLRGHGQGDIRARVSAALVSEPTYGLGVVSLPWRRARRWRSCTVCG